MRVNYLSIVIIVLLINIELPSLFSQVTIGMAEPPIPGALLDLKEHHPDGNNCTAQKGLGLPRVELSQIDSFEDILSGATLLDKETHAGLIIYNINENLCATPAVYKGIHVWNGASWENISLQNNKNGSSRIKTFIDDRDPSNPVTYNIGYFGDAGWWMLENLRAEKWPDGTDAGLTLTNQTIYMATDARYYYPQNNPSILNTNPEYGFLYNWPAATKNKTLPMDEGNRDHVQVQGICPNGWHLPSDKEWSQLTDEILVNPCYYSSKNDCSAGTLALNMKSATYGGLCHPTERGGFNVLCIGYRYNNTDIPAAALFHTSSSASLNSNWNRRFYTLQNDIIRETASENCLRNALGSVRCKQN
ncbi:FISUMP domain-containing protein [Dysgonomonas sp. 25]|uniref:FISUMP domain-containing protein n=1 Tax=Dysgonomonas sp. 25 TaxID=2302933 RepID=UPI0013D34A28|nr:FISUMP domain-containing protein [Dysgonomonas sp. 25]NDV68325.1 hypothetical protein [Dysgonomonas sp. 25]